MLKAQSHRDPSHLEIDTSQRDFAGPEALQWLNGPGEMRERIRNFDWSSTSLGPIAAWPEELRVSVSLCLGMAFPACIFWGRDGIQIYNDAYAAVMRRKHPAGLGQSWLATWPERRTELIGLRNRVFEGNAVFEEDQPWQLDREGDLKDYVFSLSMSPIVDLKGRVQGIFHTAIETTDEVKARHFKRADDLTAVFESMPDAVYIGTLEGITHCNQNALAMLGAKSLEDLQHNIGELGRRFAVRSIQTGQLIPPDQLSFVRALQTGKTVIEDVMATRQDTGEQVYIRGASAPIIENSKVVGAVAINTDVTEQYKARERLDQSERRFRALIAASFDAMYRISPDWSEINHLDDENSRPALPAESRHSDRHWLREYLLPEDHPRILKAIEEAIQAKGVFEMEHRVRLVDGSIGWSFSRAVPLLDPHGEITEWFGTASDITARKRSEETLIKSEKLAAVGRLASTIAHEINNPLEAVTNIVYLLQQDQSLAEPVRHYLKVVDEELARVSHLTKQTLSFSRGGTAVQRLHMGELVQGVLSVLIPRLRNKQITVDERIDADSTVMGVNGELRQVITNLLTNSIDAVPLHGKVWVRVASSRLDGTEQVRLTVADNGHGIPPDAKERIFEPFFSLKPDIGTGLGLWVTREIINRHGGSIHVRSSSRQGRSGTVVSIFFKSPQSQQ